MSDWQDISTAPKDGSRALFIERSGRMRVDHWHKTATDSFWRERRTPDGRYTHWMPLPAPPTPDAAPPATGGPDAD